MALGTAYLLAYNAVNLVGWAVVLAKTLSDGPGTLTASTWGLVTTLQTVALLELLHSVVGLVPGSPVAALLQVGGRNLVLLGVYSTGQYYDVFASQFGYLLLVVWALAELCRVPYYMAGLLGQDASALAWLRYSAFLVLYPVGFVAELGVDWVVFAVLGTQISSLLPAALVGVGITGHALFALYLLLAYVLAAPFLFTTMLKQRRRKLGQPRHHARQE